MEVSFDWDLVLSGLGVASALASGTLTFAAPEPTAWPAVLSFVAAGLLGGEVVRLRRRYRPDPTTVREHRDRVKEWARAQSANLQFNGIPYPGESVALDAEADASLFRQHFKGAIVERIERWNAVTDECKKAYSSASKRMGAETDGLKFAREQSGWPFKWAVIEYAAGHPERVNLDGLEWLDGAIFDPGTRQQIHPLDRLDSSGQTQVMAALRESLRRAAGWEETLRLGRAWGAVQELRPRVGDDLTWINTLARLPGHCDRCPDRIPKRGSCDPGVGRLSGEGEAG
jgi:hypothetical protein